ncbi:MAG: hypothetical protein HY913_21335 [Desulfomonile tiedjei]|nr:hypothetical protein [Desulfomonile tiedjei]
MNLCRPDRGKSCAACCGLYNVADGTKASLTKKLGARTTLFAATERSAEALIKYEESVRLLEKEAPLDLGIHVCEFTGFLDEGWLTVGCLLHPLSPGNGGVDFRGLCYYGSVACKSFFCPAWEALDHHHRTILAAVIDDWHTYGLVATDVNFVRAVFGLLERALGFALDPEVLLSSPAGEIFKEILSWKNDWPFRGSSKVRRSRYYFQEADVNGATGNGSWVGTILESLRFTFDSRDEMDGAEAYVAQRVAEFVKSYHDTAQNKT